MPDRTKVLVVDDNESVRRVTKGLLEACGWEVCDGARARSIKELSEDFRPDLVLLDVGLPDLAESLLSVAVDSARGRHAAIVLLYSGRGANELRELAASSGADGFVTKPMLGMALFEELSRWLREKGEAPEKRV